MTKFRVWKTLATVATAAALAGCGATAGPVAGAGETRVSFKKPVGKNAVSAAATAAKVPQGQLPTGYRPGPGSQLGIAGQGATSIGPAGTMPTKAAPAAGSRSTAAATGATGRGVVGADDVAANVAEAPSPDQTVEILAAPTRALRMFPMMAGDVLADAKFAPADGKLEWKLRAPERGVRIAGVRVVIEGGAAPVVGEGVPADFELPAELEGEMLVRVPFALVDTMSALASAPTAKVLQATYTFTGEDGRPIAGADGEPLALRSQVDVM